MTANEAGSSKQKVGCRKQDIIRLPTSDFSKKGENFEKTIKYYINNYNYSILYKLQ